jgi:hypothetical protein
MFPIVSVFLTTPDAHLVAIGAKDGRMKWDVVIADAKKGYWSTNAPLVIRNHLVVGVSGDFDNLPGFLKSFDPDTGQLQWTFFSTLPSGTDGNVSGGATGRRMWMTGTYDPELNLLFVGTGNPTPTLNGPARPGDNPWTCAIMAIDPDTGIPDGDSRHRRTTRTTGMRPKCRCWSMRRLADRRASCFCRRSTIPVAIISSAAAAARGHQARAAVRARAESSPPPGDSPHCLSVFQRRARRTRHHPSRMWP